jgi:hypothetical protein
LCAIRSAASADAKPIQESPVKERGLGRLWGMKGFAAGTTSNSLSVDIWLMVILANPADPHQPRQDRSVVGALELRPAQGHLRTNGTAILRVRTRR